MILFKGTHFVEVLLKNSVDKVVWKGIRVGFLWRKQFAKNSFHLHPFTMSCVFERQTSQALFLIGWIDLTKKQVTFILTFSLLPFDSFISQMRTTLDSVSVESSEYCTWFFYTSKLSFSHPFHHLLVSAERPHLRSFQKTREERVQRRKEIDSSTLYTLVYILYFLYFPSFILLFTRAFSLSSIFGPTSFSEWIHSANESCHYTFSLNPLLPKKNWRNVYFDLECFSLAPGVILHVCIPSYVFPQTLNGRKMRTWGKRMNFHLTILSIFPPN